MKVPVSLTMIGSVNLDLVATGPTLPAPGETVTGAIFAQYPGGKGANQALAARRLGAEVNLVARVGTDANAELALALLKDGQVGLTECKATATAPTGVALIAVSGSGENQIVVAPGANTTLLPGDLPDITSDATLAVLEVPVDTVAETARRCTGFFAVNLAPALPVPDELLTRADLIIVNEGEAATYGDQLNIAGGYVSVTYGASGAALFRNGNEVTRAAPPAVVPVDTTGAGDTFSAALTLALCEDQTPGDALRFACAAGALATTRPGAQPSFPNRADVDALLG